MVSGREIIPFFYRARINYICQFRAHADWTHQNRQRAWAWDWTGDHHMIAEASTDILVDEDIFSLSTVTLKSLIVVWKFVMFCNSENYTITLPFSLILVFGSWHLCDLVKKLPCSYNIFLLGLSQVQNRSGMYDIHHLFLPAVVTGAGGVVGVDGRETGGEWSKQVLCISTVLA